jgi:hypothetical protein
MAGKPKQNVTPVQIAAAVVAVSVFIGGVAYLTFRPREEILGQTGGGPVQYKDNPLTTWVKEKIQETGGDFSKLSPKDKEKLNMQTMGKGEAYFNAVAQKR